MDSKAKWLAATCALLLSACSSMGASTGVRVGGAYGAGDYYVGAARDRYGGVPWGFDVGSITVPVLVRYGLTDVLVPPAHGEWLAANVPGCIVEIETSAGHLGEDPEEEAAKNIRWLRDGIAPEGSRTPSIAAS